MEYFFIIGAQRCGTTYLYKILEQHSCICMARPMRPEPKFFLKSENDAASLADFRNLFLHAKSSEKLWGEKATTYIENPRVAGSISEAFPEAKILVMLRDPILRAVSNYRFTVDNGLESLSIEQAFLQEESRAEDFDKDRFSTSPYAYLRRGRYVEYLKPWLEVFGKNRLQTILFEDFVGRQESLFRIQDFLGVARESTDMDFSENAASSPEVELGSDARTYAEEYFSIANRQLAATFDLDLSCWSC